MFVLHILYVTSLLLFIQEKSLLIGLVGMGLSETCPNESSLEGSSMQNSKKVLYFFSFRI